MGIYINNGCTKAIRLKKISQATSKGKGKSPKIMRIA